MSSPPATSPVELRKEGDYWTLSHGGGVFRLRDMKGLAYIDELLRHPDAELHALDLVAPERGVGSARKGDAAELDLHVGQGDAGALLDAEAKAAYKRGLEELQGELEEAESFNDPERVARAREEIEFISRELARAVGLGGRDRKGASSGEGARGHGTRALKSAVG